MKNCKLNVFVSLSLTLAPDKELDVWYLQEPNPPQSGNKCFRIFWKVCTPHQPVLQFSFHVLFCGAFSTDRSLCNPLPLRFTFHIGP